MEIADGFLPDPGAADTEVGRFRDLSRLVRDAETPNRIPDFDAMWAGVERRVAVVERREPVAEKARRWWEALLGHRPLLAVAPAGAVIVALVLGYLLWMRPEAVSNECYVDSYDADTGAVLIDQDFDDDERPTVIWHVEEG